MHLVELPSTTAEVYCEAAIQESRPKRCPPVILKHDNVYCWHYKNYCPEARLGSYSTSALLSWSYSIRFLFLPFFIEPGISFKDDVALQNWIDEFFTSKLLDSFGYGIEKLLDDCKAIVNDGVEYIFDYLMYFAY